LNHPMEIISASPNSLLGPIAYLKAFSQHQIPADQGSTQVMQMAPKLLAHGVYAVKTLYLFTYSDFKTLVAPVVSISTEHCPFPMNYFATTGTFRMCGGTSAICSSHPLRRVVDMACLLFLMYLAPLTLIFRIHLLQCNASNQGRGIAEDTINHPWRPIPSGRISERGAFLLRLGLIPICIGISAFYGWDVAIASALVTVTTIIYDDFSWSSHWIGKNASNILGYTAFEVGATRVMGKLIWCLIVGLLIEKWLFAYSKVFIKSSTIRLLSLCCAVELYSLPPFKQRTLRMLPAMPCRGELLLP
jgi:UbiA prenyltransferase family